MVNMKYLLAGLSCAVLLALAPVPHAEASTLVDGETGIKDMFVFILVLQIMGKFKKNVF